MSAMGSDNPRGASAAEALWTSILLQSRTHAQATDISAIDVDPAKPGLQTSEATDKQVWENEIGHWFKSGAAIQVEH